MKPMNLYISIYSQLVYYQTWLHKEKPHLSSSVKISFSSHERVPLWQSISIYTLLYITIIYTKNTQRRDNLMSSSQESSISSLSESLSEENSGIDYQDDLRSEDGELELALAEDYDIPGQENSEDDDAMEESQAIEVDPEQLRIHQMIESHRKAEKPYTPVLIPPQKRLASNIVSKYEYTKLVGLRARQIFECSAIYITLTEQQLKTLTPLEIAEREFSEKAMPYILKRVHPNGDYELWNLPEMQGYRQLYDEML